MPHNPESDMSINEHINDGFPFREVGELYRQSVTEGWNEDQFCAAYSALVAPPLPATARIAAVSPAVEFDFDMYAKRDIVAHVEQVMDAITEMYNEPDDDPLPDPLEVEATFRAIYGEPEYVDDGWGDYVPDLDFTDDSGRSMEDLS